MRNIIVFLVYILSYTTYVFGDVASTNNNIDNKVIYKKFQEIFEKTLHDYAEEPDKQKMLDSALAGMLSSLDPYSNYMKESELESFLEWTKGEFGGIGVEIEFDKANAIKVISPIDDLAAYKAGIKPGDYIIAVDDEPVANLGHIKAVKALRGEAGTKVKVTVVSENENKVKDFELIREMVKLKAVKFARDNDIAYLRIVTFNETVITELKKAMKDIISKSETPLKGIILDLRNNPGGLLDQGVAVSEYFIPSGEIVSTKGRIPESNNVYTASKFVVKAPNVPVVVLINAGSASASEIVAGALQDYRRALIMGTKSYGKGSVQMFMPIEKNSSALYLTIGKYYTPKGRSINGKGIVPDIIIEQQKACPETSTKTTDKEKKESEKTINNYLKTNHKDKKHSAKDDVKEADAKEDAAPPAPQVSDMYKNDYQYSRAYDLIYGLDVEKQLGIVQ